MKKTICLILTIGVTTVFADVYPVDKFDDATKLSSSGFQFSREIETTNEVPDYLGYIKKRFETVLKNNAKKTQEEKIGDIEGAYVALKIYELSNEERYLKLGKSLYTNYLAKYDDSNFKPNQFDGKPLYYSTFLLKKYNAISPEQEAQIRKMVETAMVKNKNYLRFGNRELNTQMEMTIAAYLLYPEDSLFDNFKKESQIWWNEMKKIGVLDENAGNYSSLGLSELVSILELNGKTDDLKTPKWQALFASYRDVVTPSGNMPEWGDDYFEHGGKLAWIGLFEFAAKLYNDPTYSATAHKLFNRYEKASNNYRVNHLFDHDLRLLNYTPVKSELKKAVSEITYRMNSKGQKVPAFLLLRSGNQAGDAYLMLDIYGMGDHAHMEKRGSILNYEVDNVMLLHGFYRHLGRQTYDGGNGISVMQYGEKFPEFSWRAGSPLRVSLPVERLGENKTGEKMLRQFQLDWGKRYSDITINNLKLAGNNKEKLIEKAISIPLKTRGGFKLKDYNLNTQDFNALVYDIIYADGNRPEFVFRYTDDSVNQYHAWHGVNPYSMVMHSKFDQAEVLQQNNDSMGVIKFAEWGSFDSSYTRSIVLTEEGVIVSRELFAAGKSIDGWTGGLTWQFYSMDKAGKNYFASKIDEGISSSSNDKQKYSRGMLTIFDVKASDNIAVMTEEWNRKKAGKYTFASSFPLSANEDVIRTTLVIPYQKGDDVEKIAASTTFNSDKDQSKVTFKWSGKSYTVTISDNKKFTIERK